MLNLQAVLQRRQNGLKLLRCVCISRPEVEVICVTFSSDRCSSDLFWSRFLPKTFLNCNNGQRNTGERTEAEIQKRITKTLLKLSWQMRITATECLYTEQCRSSHWLIDLGQSRIRLKKLNRYNDVHNDYCLGLIKHVGQLVSKIEATSFTSEDRGKERCFTSCIS